MADRGVVAAGRRPGLPVAVGLRRLVRPAVRAGRGVSDALAPGAVRCRLEPMKKFVRMVGRHWGGIVQWRRTRAGNGLLEGAGSLIQAAERKARGYRDRRKMITIIYLIAGRLPLPSTHSI